jgi:hypothetical protein
MKKFYFLLVTVLMASAAFSQTAISNGLIGTDGLNNSDDKSLFIQFTLNGATDGETIYNISFSTSEVVEPAWSQMSAIVRFYIDVSDTVLSDGQVVVDYRSGSNYVNSDFIAEKDHTYNLWITQDYDNKVYSVDMMDNDDDDQVVVNLVTDANFRNTSVTDLIYWNLQEETSDSVTANNASIEVIETGMVSSAGLMPGVTSSRSLADVSGISVYPNPANDYIQISNDADVEIYNIAGDLVCQNINTTKEQMITVGDLVKGVYFIKLTDVQTKEVSTKKLVVN